MFESFQTIEDRVKICFLFFFYFNRLSNKTHVTFVGEPRTNKTFIINKLIIVDDTIQYCTVSLSNLVYVQYKYTRSSFQDRTHQKLQTQQKKKKAAEKQTTTKMQPEISDQILYSFLIGGSCASSTTTTTTRSSFYPFAMEDTSSQDKALATTLRKHREGERMRRERINSSLNKLRNLLSCNPKVQILLHISFH